MPSDLPVALSQHSHGMAALTGLFLLLSVLNLSNARPDGAPAATCESLLPATQPHGAGQTGANPYSLSFQPALDSYGGNYFYTPGRRYTGEYYTVASVTGK